jgi:hypothetical protein
MGGILGDGICLVVGAVLGTVFGWFLRKANQNSPVTKVADSVTNKL